MAGGGDESGPMTLRRRGAAHEYSLRFGPNMTPMVDIVMVILIFFMAATAFVGDELLLATRVEHEADGVAQDNDPMELPPVRLEISLVTGPDGEVIASGVGVDSRSINDVLARLSAFVEGTAVDQVVLVIRATDETPYEAVVRVHEVGESLGITKIGILLNR